MQRVWRITRWVGAIGLGFTVLFFWLVPAEVRSDAITWLGIGVSALCTLGIVLAARKHLATWLGFAMLVAGLVGIHFWLWRMWSLWESPVRLVRNVNTVMGLLAIDLVIALIADVVLMLIFRDSSPVFIGIVWVFYPLVLIGVALTAPDMETFLAPNNLHTQVLSITPMTVLPSICCLSLPAFLIHLSIVVVKEIRRK